MDKGYIQLLEKQLLYFHLHSKPTKSGQNKLLEEMGIPHYRSYRSEFKEKPQLSRCNHTLQTLELKVSYEPTRNKEENTKNTSLKKSQT